MRSWEIVATPKSFPSGFSVTGIHVHLDSSQALCESMRSWPVSCNARLMVYSLTEGEQCRKCSG